MNTPEITKNYSETNRKILFQPEESKLFSSSGPLNEHNRLR